MSGNNFFRVRVRVPIVFRSSAFPIGTRTRTRTRTRSCHVTQKLYFLNHAKIWSVYYKMIETLDWMHPISQQAGGGRPEDRFRWSRENVSSSFFR